MTRNIRPHTSTPHTKTLFAALLLCVSAAITSSADDWTFSLQQAGRQKAGPFTFKDDETVTLLTKDFTLLEADRDKKTFKLKMNETGNVFGPYQFKPGGRVQIGRAAFSIQDLFIPGLKLSVSYKSGMGGSKGILDELIGIFSPLGRAGIDLEPHPDITIFGQTTYLMPLEKAGKEFGMKRMTSGSTVNLPGFPRNSFYYYQATGNYSDNCNKALLVADLQKQVVAIQFIDENPKTTRLTMTESGARLYNIVQYRQTTPSARNYVRRTATTSGDIAIIKTEYIQNGKVKEYTELYVPKVMVNLWLDTLQHFRNK